MGSDRAVADPGGFLTIDDKLVALQYTSKRRPAFRFVAAKGPITAMIGLGDTPAADKFAVLVFYILARQVP